MSESTFFISKAALCNLIRCAESRVSGISSVHLSEAVAAALGFPSHASLLVALADRPTVESLKPSNARLVDCLKQLGYPRIPRNLKLLPELDRSYSPFGTFPLRRRNNPRWLAWRNLMVAAVNEGLEQRRFGLSPGEDWWTDSGPGGDSGFHSTYRFLFGGDVPAVASVDACNGDELSIHVILNPRDNEVDPKLANGLKDGDAYAFCWLERRLGAWIQDGGEQFSCKREVLHRVADTSVEPLGYSDLGSLMA